MKVGIAYSLAPPGSEQPLEGPDDRFEEFDKIETVDAIADVIRGEGHEVALLGDGREFLTRVLADPPDFVFNIAEGEGVGRSREARVPAALEMLGIPYSGSDPLTLAASLDKDVAKRLVASSALASVPRGHLLLGPPPKAREKGRWIEMLLLEIFGTDEIDLREHPLILKPAFEGSSKGIRDQGIARSVEEVLGSFRQLRQTYDQPILVEEFIGGQEVTVGIVGNWLLSPETTGEVLGVMRVVPNTPTDDFVYSLEVKRHWRNRVRYECPAQIEGFDLGRIKIAATMAWLNLGCRDCARFDFRVDPRGVPFFIEANPLPGLAPVTSDLVILAEGHGVSHADLIRKILDAALTRVGMA